MFSSIRRLRLAEKQINEITNRLLVTIGNPSKSFISNYAVASVTLPGVEGVFTLTHNHSQMVSMLKPGVVTVNLDGGRNKQYFISGGFAFMAHRPMSSKFEAAKDCCYAYISTLEAVPLDQLDKERAVQLLSEISASNKDNEKEKTLATLGSSLLADMLKTI